MMLDDKNNTRNEFPISIIVILDVLHLHILQEIKKLKFHNGPWRPFWIFRVFQELIIEIEAPTYFFWIPHTFLL